MSDHKTKSRLRRVVLGIVFVFFAVGGVFHFAMTDAEASIVPPWLPDHRLLVLISGVCEWAGAAGILWRVTRSAAGWGLVALTVAVTPANYFMWQHAGAFPGVPEWALVLRLVFQPVLVVGIWWGTREG